MAAGIHLDGTVPRGVAGNEPNGLDILARKIDETRVESLNSEHHFIYPLHFGNRHPPSLASYSVSFDPKLNTLLIRREELPFSDSSLFVGSVVITILSVLGLIALIIAAATGSISGLWVLLPIVLGLVFATKIILSARKMLQQGNKAVEEMAGKFQELAFKYKCRLELTVPLADGARRVTRTISSECLLACGKQMVETLRDHTELPHDLRLIAREYLYVIPKASA